MIGQQRALVSKDRWGLSAKSPAEDQAQVTANLGQTLPPREQAGVETPGWPGPIGLLRLWLKKERGQCPV